MSIRNLTEITSSLLLELKEECQGLIWLLLLLFLVVGKERGGLSLLLP